MRNSNLDGISIIFNDLRDFKKKYPDACWSISEVPFETSRKSKKERLNKDGTVHTPAEPAKPFDVYLATDDLIGEPSHFFALIATHDISEGFRIAVATIDGAVEKYTNNRSK